MDALSGDKGIDAMREAVARSEGTFNAREE